MAETWDNLVPETWGNLLRDAAETIGDDGGRVQPGWRGRMETAIQLWALASLLDRVTPDVAQLAHHTTSAQGTTATEVLHAIAKGPPS